MKKNHRMLALVAGVGVAAYFLFGQKPAAAAAAVTGVPWPIVMSPGTVTYLRGSPTGYAVALPLGATWVTVNGAVPGSPTQGIFFPATMTPTGTYVWRDATGTQQTTTVA